MQTRRAFIAHAAGAALLLAGCESRNSTPDDNRQRPETEHDTEPDTSGEPEPQAPEASEPEPSPTADAIVAYFSHAGENYQVGVIDEGNTAVIAKMIAEKTGADTFEIVPVDPYPEGYDECCDVALAEQGEGARPAYEGDVDLTTYSTVYLGYPIWWGDLPMVVYTFLEEHDWEGKDIRPFCTHGGSRLAGTESTIAETCDGADVLPGLAIAGTAAQNDRGSAEADVDAWL